jgi:hypothetical protein
MPECLLDNRALELDASLKTWGQLLTVVDAAAASAGRMVTAVRFDGVAQPSYRHPHTTARALAHMARIHVETGTHDDLVQPAIEAAIAGLHAIDRSVGPLAAAFRAGDDAASGDLAEFLIALQSLTALTKTLADASGVDLEPIDNGAGTGVLEAIGVALERLLAAQQNEDAKGTADALEQEVGPALRAWQRLFVVGLRYAA